MAEATRQAASATAVERFIDRSRPQRDAGDDHISFFERPSCTVQEAIKASGLSRTTLYEKIASGELKTKMVGRRRLIHVPSLLALVSPDPSPDETISS